MSTTTIIAAPSFLSLASFKIGSILERLYIAKIDNSTWRVVSNNGGSLKDVDGITELVQDLLAKGWEIYYINPVRHHPCDEWGNPL
jgi:hypothetical protein